MYFKQAFIDISQDVFMHITQIHSFPNIENKRITENTEL